MALQAAGGSPPWARPVRRKRPGAPRKAPFRRKIPRGIGAVPRAGLLFAGMAAALYAAFLLLSLALLALPRRAASPGGSVSAAARAEAVVALAESLEGTQYTAGGDTPSGFDCSGYTAYVYQTAAGLSLPHSTAAQAKMGEAAAPAGLAPGDLVFFDTAGKGAATHCGIYLGGGSFLAANSGTGNRVSRESLSAPYWAGKFLFGRKLLAAARADGAPAESAVPPGQS